ncbi:ABC transporter permease [Roseomonas sp. KE0001]|uniref:ABC transporter permease n=1 Tax=Roseomonas sp. KE0001 TaxID=2479201 RepID=UPI0018DFB150|nr:ABC transporter permease [Roseomonas sp. KE0001]MBI0435886.1 ABC transporter permease [Roseomonas sp. KE0001]
MSGVALARPGRRWPASLVVGGAVVGVIALLAILGPWIAPYPPEEFAVLDRLRPPSAAHWFGTDEFGRDVFSRVLAGAHYSLLMGFGATGLSLLVGVPLGMLAAFHRGWVEEAVMRGVDLLISIPPVLLGLLILATTDPGLGKTVAAVGLVYVPIMTRLSRAVALGLLAEDFVDAARARADGMVRILWSEILPNAWSPIIVETALRITFAILLGSALSFLGLGPQPPASEWGLMIAESRPFIEEAPWIGLMPGLCLCALLVAVNMVGEGLRDLLDPRMRGRGHG